MAAANKVSDTHGPIGIALEVSSNLGSPSVTKANALESKVLTTKFGVHVFQGRFLETIA